ncbi:hypothetical protein NC651_040600 [Populus alba x Populus x berolinensis]|nr:hypothetical protein NC651_040600 [Populus alba x Populus x berolinensis]
MMLALKLEPLPPFKAIGLLLFTDTVHMVSSVNIRGHFSFFLLFFFFLFEALLSADSSLHMNVDNLLFIVIQRLDRSPGHLNIFIIFERQMEPFQAPILLRQ